MSSVEFEFSETPETVPVRISAAVVAAILAFGGLFLPFETSSNLMSLTRA